MSRFFKGNSWLQSFFKIYLLYYIVKSEVYPFNAPFFNLMYDFIPYDYAFKEHKISIQKGVNYGKRREYFIASKVGIQHTKKK